MRLFISATTQNELERYSSGILDLFEFATNVYKLRNSFSKQVSNLPTFYKQFLVLMFYAQLLCTHTLCLYFIYKKNYKMLLKCSTGGPFVFYLTRSISALTPALSSLINHWLCMNYPSVFLYMTTLFLCT